MKSFRKKIFLAFLVPFILLLVLMIPLENVWINRVVRTSMEDQADSVIEELKSAKNTDAIIAILKNEKYQHFYRVGIFNSKGRILFDSHAKHLLGPFFYSFSHLPQEEVQKALQDGQGYREGYSHLFHKKLVYFAKRFSTDRKIYVLRLAFPFEHIQDLKTNLQQVFFFFSFIILVLFSSIAASILHFFTKPIKQILAAIQPYEEGTILAIPKITLKTNPQDAWTHLANTINSLSEKVQAHIETITLERNEKASILESLTEGVLATDRDMRISYANSMAKKLLHLEELEVGAFFPKTRYPDCFHLLEQALDSQAVVNDTLKITHGPITNYLNAVISPRTNQSGTLLVLQDTSTYYKVLEMRKAFIANASHELKTPIAIIQGFTETLQDGKNLPEETINDILKRIVSNCSRMSKMVTDLLTLADIENIPASRLQEFNLIELLDECAEKARLLQPTTQIEYTPQQKTPVFLFADRDLIEIACTNLIINGVKYNDKDPLIRIVVTQTPEQTVVSITDNGIGIPVQDQERIFERFYTVNKARSKKQGGSGLGLSIVQTVMEKHHGTVVVHSVPGVGSTFTLTFPHTLQGASE